MSLVLALGFFDGVHLGHGALLSRTVQVAHANGWESAAMTFDRSPGKDGHLLDNTTKEPGQGSSSTVSYNRAGLKISGRPDAWTERPPVVGLFHELAHSYNAATGTMDYGAYKYDGTVAEDRIGLVGAEWQAVGLEHPHVKSNPDGLNENGMRRLLGIEERTYY